MGFAIDGAIVCIAHGATRGEVVVNAARAPGILIRVREPDEGLGRPTVTATGRRLRRQ
jgi:hypothetical protein